MSQSALESKSEQSPRLLTFSFVGGLFATNMTQKAADLLSCREAFCYQHNTENYGDRDGAAHQGGGGKAHTLYQREEAEDAADVE